MKELKKERDRLVKECQEKKIKYVRGGMTVKQQIAYLKDKLNAKPAGTEPVK
jgi:hypothetical protein